MTLPHTVADGRSATEIQQAFGEIATGLNRLGSALAKLMSSWGKAEAAVPASASTPARKSRKRGLNAGEAMMESAEVSLVTPAPTSALPSPSSASRSVDSTTLAHRVKGATLIVPNTAPLPTSGPVVVADPTAAATATTPSKSRLPKDPNAPKRPPSSFLLYVKAMRGRVQAENPNLSYLELTKLLVQLWEKADKKKWEEEVTKLFDEYRKDMKTYERKLEGDAQLPQLPTVINPSDALLGATDKAVGEEVNVTPQSDKPKKKKKSKSLGEGQDSALKALKTSATPQTILPHEVPSVPPTAAAHPEKTKKGKKDKSKEKEREGVADTNVSMSIEVSPNPTMTTTSSATTGEEKQISPKKANRTKRDVPEPILSSTLLTSDPADYVGEKGPLVAVPNPSALGSSQLLFGPSSSQQSGVDVNLAQAITSVTGVETTPEAPKIKRKKRDKRQGTQAAAPTPQ